MKKLLLSLFSLSFIVSSKAQPTLTAANSNPILGEVSTNRSCPFMSPGPGGAAQTWNFSSATFSSSATNTMVTPASIPGSGAFVGATLASNDGSGNNAFTAVNSNTYQIVGFKAGTINIVYSNREDIMRYPLTMSNSYSDAFAATFTTTSTFYRMGASTVTADGYGTVITPAGTYTNALRVRLHQVYRDSTWIGFPYLVYYDNDEYLWYTPNIHAPVFAVYTFSNSFGSPTQQSIYLQSISTGVSENAPLASEFQVYPNPTANHLLFNFENMNESEAEAIIYTPSGIEAKRVIITKSNGNNFQLDVSDLPNGLYYSRLNMNGVLSENKKFVVLR